MKCPKCGHRIPSWSNFYVNKKMWYQCAGCGKIMSESSLQKYAVAKVACFGILLTILFLGLLVWAGNANAADAEFSWLPNSEQDLAGYTIHCGSAPRDYVLDTDVGLPEIVDGRQHYTFHDISDGDWYCAITAYDEAGQHSAYSNEVTSDSPPGIVQGLAVEVVVNVQVMVKGE